MKKLPMTMTSLALAGAFVSSGSAAILDLSPDIDATLRASAGPQAGSQINFVGDTGSGTDFLRTALAFNLNQPELIGATINSVTLTMTVRGPDSNSADGNIDVNLHQLGASFDSATTWFARNATDNWSTAGGDFGSVLATLAGDPGTAIAGDEFALSSGALTNSVSAANGSSLYLLLKSGNEDSTERNLFQFASNDNTTAQPGPVLTIDYTPVPEPGSTVLLGLGGLALMIRRRR